jgi:hypothetical protein
MLNIYAVHKVTYPFVDYGGQYKIVLEFVEWSFSAKKMEDKYWYDTNTLEYSDLIDNGVAHQDMLGTTHCYSVIKLF